jgi:cytochrome P450
MDLAHHTIDFETLEGGKMEKVTVAEFLARMFKFFVERQYQTTLHIMFPALITMPFLTKLDRWFSRNGYRFRQGMLDILRLRAKSIVTGEHSIEEGDLFTCMLNFDGYRDDWESIVDDVTTMIFAGSHTQQITTSNMMWYLEMQPELKKKCFAEVDELLGSCEPDILSNYDYEKSM